MKKNGTSSKNKLALSIETILDLAFMTNEELARRVRGGSDYGACAGGTTTISGYPDCKRGHTVDTSCCSG